MQSDRIERQYKDEQELYRYLMDNNEISFASYIDEVYKKVLLLSAASYFESVISKTVINFAKDSTSIDHRVAVLVEKKAISRQYHTLFQWDSKNTNSFWGLFGEETKNSARKTINASEELRQAEKDFLELGQERNLLVHENFSEYGVNNTVDEIYKKYKSACKFIAFIPEVLKPTFLRDN